MRIQGVNLTLYYKIGSLKTLNYSRSFKMSFKYFVAFVISADLGPPLFGNAFVTLNSEMDENQIREVEKKLKEGLSEDDLTLTNFIKIPS